MKDNKALKVFIVLIMIVFFVHQAYSSLYNPVTTQNAEYFTVADGISASAMFVRPENIIIGNTSGTKHFKIENGIVYYDAYISPYTAILGGNVKVPTLWGDATIKIPPLTKTNQSFKLIDVGIMNEKTQKKGDEIVKILIQIPTSITDEEFYLYEKLKEINLKKRNAPIFQ